MNPYPQKAKPKLPPPSPGGYQGKPKREIWLSLVYSLAENRQLFPATRIVADADYYLKEYENRFIKKNKEEK